jgi:hypothetical protein
MTVDSEKPFRLKKDARGIFPTVSTENLSSGVVVVKSAKDGV